MLTKIFWTLIILRSSDIHLKIISPEVPCPLITKISPLITKISLNIIDLKMKMVHQGPDSPALEAVSYHQNGNSHYSVNATVNRGQGQIICIQRSKSENLHTEVKVRKSAYRVQGRPTVDWRQIFIISAFLYKNHFLTFHRTKNSSRLITLEELRQNDVRSLWGLRKKFTPW